MKRYQKLLVWMVYGEENREVIQYFTLISKLAKANEIHFLTVLSEAPTGMGKEKGAGKAFLQTILGGS